MSVCAASVEFGAYVYCTRIPTYYYHVGLQLLSLFKNQTDVNVECIMRNLVTSPVVHGRTMI